MNTADQSDCSTQLFSFPRGRGSGVRLWIIVAIFIALPAPARASQVRIPLTIDYLTLREALKHKLYTAPGGRAMLWNGLDDCQFLYAENPEFSRATAGGTATVKLETANSLGLGVAMGSQCVGAIQWSGIVEALGVPYIAPGLQLKFHFTDLNVYDSAHQKSQIVSKGFDLIKSYLVPRLEDFSYDLNPAVQQLGAMINDSIPADAAGRVRAAIASLTAEPNIEARDDGVRVTLVMTVPDMPSPAAIPGAPVAATPAELKAFQDSLDQWDAFLVFTIKQLGDAVGDQQFRDQLLQILLDSRYRLVQALNNPSAATGPDPVRLIFLDEWTQLHDAVRAAAQRGMLGARALEFMSFISAGDALFALDQAAPALGMRISAADLRRLAHIMAPTAAGDPLKFNYGEDRDMKKLFAVPEPPRSRHPIEEEDIPASTPASSPRPTNASTPTPSPSRGTSSGLSPFPRGKGLGVRLLALLSPREADAAEDSGAMQITRLQDVADRLYRQVVSQENADAYRRDMALLLNLSAAYQLNQATAGPGNALDTDNGRVYVTLVLSTAWQESCWRQFVMDGARIRWLESATGDIGLMQVNKHVWRGFYDIERLKWDVLYNAGAGCEILARMIQYASMSQSKFDPVLISTHLARSAYAGYNGGPGACNRWRRRREPPALKQIDSSFLDKYHAVENGTQIDILSCARSWSH
jgi:soluble lytic murein transglycosylase-like protein